MARNPDVFAHPASRLALEVFRLNGALIEAGDAVVAPLGLTSARWQVLGAIAESGEALTVAGIARSMGLARQSVQRVVDDLAAASLLRFAPNPHHRRARLVRFTERGAAAFAEAGRRWLPVADALAAHLTPGEAERVVAALRAAREHLQAGQTAAEGEAA
jgi:DNA-binding MarR family transcriptional regulator